MRLITKNNSLFVLSQSGNLIGEAIFSVDGKGVGDDDPITFAKVFSGQGTVLHQCDRPPNPFFVKSWGEVFQNPELLPPKTKNIFIDESTDAHLNFRKVEL
jgi:fructose 1,6-bisphosphatase